MKLANFTQWIIRNKLIVFIVSILVALLLSIIIIYSTNYGKYKKIYFTAEENEDTLYIPNKDIIKSDNDNFVKINLEKITYKAPVLKPKVKPEDADVYEKGNYVLLLTYSSLAGTSVSDVNVTALVNVNWQEARGVSYQKTIDKAGKPTDITVDFNFPKNDNGKYPGTWPFSSKWPDVYLEVKYRLSDPNNPGQSSRTAYLFLPIDWPNQIING